MTRRSLERFGRKTGRRKEEERKKKGRRKEEERKKVGGRQPIGMQGAIGHEMLGRRGPGKGGVGSGLERGWRGFLEWLDSQRAAMEENVKTIC